MLIILAIIIGVLAGLKIVIDQWTSEKSRQQRRTYYRDSYLKSDDWKRKRWVVLNRDNHRCAYCGGALLRCITKNMRIATSGENQSNG